MNFTEQTKARTLALIIPRNEISSSSGWKGYALKATILIVGFGTYVLLCKRKPLFRSPKWPLRFLTRKNKSNEDIVGSEGKEISEFTEQRPTVLAYNREICPICLGAPKISVRAPCGHLLCADCLASYCDVRVALAPPPCPLCRAPLDSVALACDFTIVSSDITDVKIDASIRTWIQEYNLHHGLIGSGRSRNTILTCKRALLIVNSFALLLIVILVIARLQILSWTDWTTFGSAIDLTLGFALMTCMWFKCQE
ncbi:E3 ubiquitin-protein ligase RNF170-like isoform X1 [Vespula maculifrons]|uniref:E3 ubiquitin-protein ligase RNF170-like isoform X1 n=1 Tax=Vespula maculifrons TaxID=7453 RepID=A0ABD2B4P3_VESMC